MSGFITLRRKVRQHPLFAGDPAKLGAWTWLLLTACWKDAPYDVNGKTITLQRGQLCVSLRQLASEWNWSKSAVDRFITRLETETMVTREAGHGKLVLTICNYDKYQDQRDTLRDSSGTATGTRAGHERDTKEQGNKVIPLSNDNGAEFSDQQFWANARAYLGASRGSLIGKWCRDYGQAATARAITEAQLNRAADPIPYIERTLRRGKSDAEALPIC